MGSFIGHVLPGSMFLLVGIWHMFCIMYNLATAPKEFRAKVWHPCRLPGPLKYLEIILLIFGTFFDMLPVELLMATHFKPFIHGAIAPGHLNNFEHAGMLFLFFMFATAVLLNETTSLLPVPEGFLHLVAASAFLGEFLLFLFHSTNHQGIEGRYHTLLVLEIGLCMVMAVLCAAYPRSFILDLGGAIALTLQGLWFWQTAFSLYGSLVPSGCDLLPDTLHCPKVADEVRGMAIANVQFVYHIVAMASFTLFLYGIIMGVWGQGNIWIITSLTQSSAEAGSQNGHRHHMEEMKSFVLEDDDEDADYIIPAP